MSRWYARARRGAIRFRCLPPLEHGDGKMPIRNEEPLTFETVKLVERSYK